MEQNDYIERLCCPSCGENRSEHSLDVPDFRVSGDFFPIHRCLGCGLHYTKLVPTIESIGSFYKADSYDSHRLDNSSIISRIYRMVRGLNVKNKVGWIRKYKNTGVVVDYGCGLGHFVSALQAAGFEGYGYEIDDEVRALAKNELGLRLESLEEFKALPESSVDVITMWHVLEHVYDLNDDFKTIIQKVKTDGLVFIAVPNFRSYDAQCYGKFWEAYDVPRHLYHFDSHQVRSFCEGFGLVFQEAIPMKFDSYYVSMRSEKNKPKGAMLRGLWIGVLSNVKGKKLGYSSHVFVFRKP